MNYLLNELYSSCHLLQILYKRIVRTILSESQERLHLLRLQLNQLVAYILHTTVYIVKILKTRQFFS